MKSRKSWIASVAILSAFAFVLVIAREHAKTNQSDARNAVSVKPGVVFQETQASAPAPKTNEGLAVDLASVDYANPVLLAQISLNQGYYNREFATLSDAQVAEMGMNREQLNRVQAIYNKTASNRLAIERAIAQVKPLSPTESIITIPAYGDRGLEKAFYDEVAGTVGSDIAKKIEAQRGSLLRVANGGFGTASQELKVTLKGKDWEVVHRIITGDGATIAKNSYIRPSETDVYQSLTALFPQPSR